MLKRKKRKMSMTDIKCVWYNKKKKILNLTKNRPTGGNPVKQKKSHRYKLFSTLYF